MVLIWVNIICLIWYFLKKLMSTKYCIYLCTFMHLPSIIYICMQFHLYSEKGTRMTLLSESINKYFFISITYGPEVIFLMIYITETMTKKVKQNDSCIKDKAKQVPIICG